VTIFKPQLVGQEVVVSGWLVGFSDFQRNLGFGSKVAESDDENP